MHPKFFSESMNLKKNSAFNSAALTKEDIFKLEMIFGPVVEHSIPT